MSNNIMQHKWEDVIRAWLDGQPVQYKTYENRRWATYKYDPDISALTYFDNQYFEWRVKPPTKKYRVAKFQSTANKARVWTESLNNPDRWQEWEASKDFVGWLTDWVEYD
jgi:hypothetical protein